MNTLLEQGFAIRVAIDCSTFIIKNERREKVYEVCQTWTQLGFLWNYIKFEMSMCIQAYIKFLLNFDSSNQSNNQPENLY